ncbi:MAG: hypothetical protein R6V85_06835 [Polyangia bacterium]
MAWVSGLRAVTIRPFRGFFTPRSTAGPKIDRLVLVLAALALFDEELVRFLGLLIEHRALIVELFHRLVDELKTKLPDRGLRLRMRGPRRVREALADRCGRLRSRRARAAPASPRR